MRCTLPIAFLLLALVATPAAAQGSDLCQTAQPIEGTGSFFYDTIPATSGGPLEAFYYLPELASMYNDVWFRWVAPSSGVYEISTFTHVYQRGYGSPEVDQTRPKIVSAAVSADGRTVLDMCPDCRGLWLDGGELARLIRALNR